MRLRSSKSLWAVGGLAAFVLTAGVAGWYGVAHPMRVAARAYEDGRWGAAIRIGLSYLETHPKSTQARLVVARSYMPLGRLEEAEQQFAQAEELGRDGNQARARVLTRLNRLQKAADLYERLCEAWPDDPQCIQQWAASLISLNKFDQAIQLGERLAGVRTARSACS